MNRTARVERLTHETQIVVELDLDGSGIVEVGTGVPFFDHMLDQLGRHELTDERLEPRHDRVAKRHIQERYQEDGQVVDDGVQHKDLLRLGHCVRILCPVVLELGDCARYSLQKRGEVGESDGKEHRREILLVGESQSLLVRAFLFSFFFGCLPGTV